MARAKQPVSINGIEFDALIDESRTLEATVPEYSVESGFSVSDAIILSPEKLDMTLFVTNTPVTWYNRHGGSQNRVDSVVKQLEELYYAGEPVTIVTSDATYSNMAIESITFSKSTEVGYAREIPISFGQNDHDPGQLRQERRHRGVRRHRKHILREFRRGQLRKRLGRQLRFQFGQQRLQREQQIQHPV